MCDASLEWAAYHRLIFSFKEVLPVESHNNHIKIQEPGLSFYETR